jgi:hypothetical protein
MRRTRHAPEKFQKYSWHIQTPPRPVLRFPNLVIESVLESQLHFHKTTHLADTSIFILCCSLKIVILWVYISHKSDLLDSTASFSNRSWRTFLGLSCGFDPLQNHTKLHVRHAVKWVELFLFYHCNFLEWVRVTLRISSVAGRTVLSKVTRWDYSEWYILRKRDRSCFFSAHNLQTNRQDHLEVYFFYPF